MVDICKNEHKFLLYTNTNQTIIHEQFKACKNKISTIKYFFLVPFHNIKIFMFCTGSVVLCSLIKKNLYSVTMHSITYNMNLYLADVPRNPCLIYCDYCTLLMYLCRCGCLKVSKSSRVRVSCNSSV